MNRAFNAQTLEIRHWRFPENALQPPGKRSFACAHGFRSTVKGKSTCEPGTRPAFEVMYNRVRMHQVISKSISSLRRPGIDNEIPCGERGELRADTAYKR